MNRGLARALAGCVAGGALVLVAQAVTWSSADLARPGGGVQHVSVSGHAVASGLPAIGWALLALALALVAANGALRRIVGLLITIVGASGIATAIVARGRVDAALAKAAFVPPPHPVHAGSGGWWVVAAVGGVVAALAGVSALRRGGAWSGMGRKYDAPRPDASPEREPAAVGPDSAAIWQALDRGEDPT